MTVKNGKNTEAFEKQKGRGRPKGVPNKATAAIKEMVEAALQNAGGVDYLVRQAEEQPVAFMGLVGKVLPMQISGQLDHAVKVSGALKWQAPQ